MQKIEQKNIKSIFLEIIWKTENNEELTTTTKKKMENLKNHFKKLLENRRRFKIDEKMRFKTA